MTKSLCIFVVLLVIGFSSSLKHYPGRDWLLVLLAAALLLSLVNAYFRQHKSIGR